ncbi:EamA/RhaT family transporter [Metarhizobium album]|uniref:EamA/RhaT family transporter n=1 Tax=Metarhizobium album TaxID=2182425 RepID=A0A2U2DYG7_9HYPH|nr:DMT family transporter [Rhizobium album]PWE58346.1 EamA/RhaT family transporter [Rhizobium album]
MLFPTLSSHTKGLVLTTIGGLALSLDVPLVRLGDGDVWSVTALRSLTTVAATFILWFLVRRFTSSRPPLVPGWAAAFAALLYGLSSMAFLGAVFNTTTANVVFIVAFTPMFAALLSWLFLGERPGVSTLVTMAIMIVGVGLIVENGLSAGHWLGDLLSALTALLIGGAITIGRATQREMGFVPLIATVIPAAIALLMVVPAGYHVANPFWVMLDGGIMLPLAFWCLATGPRYLSASEVGMFYLLETILAPIWVWMIFSEVPALQSLAGGAILIGALVGYSLWQMRSRSRSLATPLSH